jgi:hypothetical protein
MKKIEALFSFFAILGSLMVANQVHTGWYLFLASSLLAIVWGLKTKNYYFTAMQGFFVVSNAMGVVNYCL